MKLQFKRRTTSASVLMVALLAALILGFTLGGYLLWVGSQNRLTRESHAWNAALVVAEAGIEEGMAQVNWRFGTNSPLNTNGWANPSSGVYGPVHRDLVADFVTNGSYKALIIRSNGLNNGCPVIYSTGYTIVPLIGQPIRRVIEVKTAATPPFPGGMAALNDISFKGNNIWIDSFDSMDPKYSTNGMYYQPWRKAGGDVASVSGLIEVANANINGMVRTGPGGTYSVGPMGYAGDLGWTGPGIQAGWYANDFNAEFRDVALPADFVIGMAPAPGQNGSTNLYVMGSADYTITGKLTTKAKENIEVLGNARLYVTSDVLMQGQSTITIQPGASLEIYVAGASSVLTSVNTTGNANTFRYYGLPTNTSLTWNGNATYVGCVYAPQASFECGGGGSTIYDYQGACVVKSVRMNGHFKFHFDEALKRGPKSPGFYAKSWRELSPVTGN